jgi:DNA mismatch repair protein MutL
MLRLVGQVGATYLITEGVDGLYLIDQHAAHERILYEKLMTQHEKKALSSQSLLSPQVIQLDPASSKLIEDQLPVLKHFGFEIDNFGPNTYQIRAIPSIFTQGDPSRLLKSLVEDFEEDETPLKNEVEARIAGRVCKTMAIKAGQVLTSSEQQTLLAELERCVNPRTCPHGRPTMIHLSVDLLERQFGRRGAR